MSSRPPNKAPPPLRREKKEGEKKKKKRGKKHTTPIKNIPSQQKKNRSPGGEKTGRVRFTGRGPKSMRRTGGEVGLPGQQPNCETKFPGYGE